jgi:hypothetical protein
MLKAFRLSKNPILLSQIFASLSGGVSMIAAAALLSGKQFALFAILALLGTTAVGALRAGLLRPAMIHQRSAGDSRVPVAYAAVGISALTILALPIMWALGVRSWADLVLLSAFGIFPLVHDWLRSRYMADSRRWPIAWADLARLGAVGVVVLLGSATNAVSSGVALQALIGAASVPAIAILLWRMRRLQRWEPFSRYSRQARLQLVEYSVSQLNLTVPMLILGAVGGGSLIAGLRLAQTLLGPLNLIFSASALNIMADGATDKKLRDDLALIARGKVVARRLLVTAISIVAGLLVVVGFLPELFRGVSAESLWVGLLLTGVAAIGSGWAGVHTVILRLLGSQLSVTVSRVALVTATWIAFLIGFAVGGVDTSLVSGFAASAVAYPLTTELPPP